MNLCCSHTIVVVNTEIETKNCIVIGGAVVALLMMGSSGYLIFHLIAPVISSSSSEKIIGFQVSANISGAECALDTLILIYSSTGFHLFVKL